MDSRNYQISINTVYVICRGTEKNYIYKLKSLLRKNPDKIEDTAEDNQFVLSTPSRAA